VGAGEVMMKAKRKKHLRKHKKYEDRLLEQAENRRKLLRKLDLDTQKWVTRDFAKLGLFQ
jgi:hypothetical protein